jgi:hypothetical protein
LPGIGPRIAAGDVLTSCIVHATDSRQSFAIGTPIEVVLEFPFWNEYQTKFTDGMEVVLHDGSRVLAG